MNYYIKTYYPELYPLNDCYEIHIINEYVESFILKPEQSIIN